MRWTDHAIGMLAAGLACTAQTAQARTDASTRLVDCASQSCLLVSGYRDDQTSTVRINGHDVAVDGKRHWHVSLPITTLRAWSPPFARSVSVSITDPKGGAETHRQTDLPIGLLGHADLAFVTTHQH